MRSRTASGAESTRGDRLTVRRLLYVIDSLGPGGAERSFAAMLPGIVASGIDVQVAYLKERPGLHEIYRAGGATLHPLLGRSRVERARQVSDLARRLRPDLVHTTLFEADVAGRVGARLAGIPSVTSLVNETYGSDHRADPTLSMIKLRGAQALDIATARLARRFHAVSEHVATTMARHLLIPRRRIDVVVRGRDPAVLGVRSPARRADARRALGLDDDDTLVLALARHEFQKGLDVLIRAMPRVRESLPRARLLVAGREGTQTPELRDLVTRLGLGTVCELAGARDDVAELLCAADVFVLPSRREGMPGAVIEAIALETPVVATDLPQVREVVGAGGALLMPLDDPDALAKLVVDVVDNPSRTAERVAVARQEFADRFTIESVVAQMLAFYARALD